MRLCPFCQKTDGSLEHTKYVGYKKVKWFVKCPNCEARTGLFETPEEAKTSWAGKVQYS